MDAARYCLPCFCNVLIILQVTLRSYYNTKLHYVHSHTTNVLIKICLIRNWSVISGQGNEVERVWKEHGFLNPHWVSQIFSLVLVWWMLVQKLNFQRPAIQLAWQLDGWSQIPSQPDVKTLHARSRIGWQQSLPLDDWLFLVSLPQPGPWTRGQPHLRTFFKYEPGFDTAAAYGKDQLWYGRYDIELFMF